MKPVRIQAGPHKGMIGVVRHVTPTHVEVELDCQSKKIQVARNLVSVLTASEISGPKNGSADARSIPRASTPPPNPQDVADWLHFN